MNPTDQIERAIKQWHLTTSAGTDRRILDDAFVALEESKQRRSVGTGSRILQTALRSRMIKFTAAAAMLLIALTLFFKAPAERVIDLDQIHTALGKMQNVCIENFGQGETEPLQQIWLSRTLNLTMFKTEQQSVLYDIHRQVKMTKDSASGSMTIDRVAKSMLAIQEEALEKALRLVPFAGLSAAPKGAQWVPVLDANTATTVSGAQAYDLVWKQIADDSTRYLKWRVFADVQTDLPKRAEWYAKFNPEEEYRLETFAVVTYPSESEIRIVVQDVFGPDYERLSEAEYMGTPAPR